MPAPTGFSYVVHGNGEVVITHHGRRATVLRGGRATEFLDEVADDPQLTMARVTGNDKRGNERDRRNHPRHAR